MLSEMLAVGSAGSAEPDGPVDVHLPVEVPPSRRDLRRKRKPWAPNEDDHSIYEWVMLKGERQGFVADLFGISQATVSRIVERYEKCQAHAEPREGGLDPAERVRAQRRLTYQRNEKIIRNCLRLAREVEGFQEVSQSTSAAPGGGLAGMREIRCVNKVFDRTGLASRYYRLAFRAGLEQLELVEQEPAAMPALLTEEEEAEQERQAQADRAEIQAVRERTEEESRKNSQSIMDRLESAEREAAQAREDAATARQELAGVLELLGETQRELAAAEQAAEEEDERASGQTEGLPRPEPGDLRLAEGRGQETRAQQAVVELKLHNLNNANGAKTHASNGACGCDANGAAEKKSVNVHNGRGQAVSISQTVTPDLSQRETLTPALSQGETLTPALSQRETLTPALSQGEREKKEEEPPRRLPKEWLKHIPAK